MTLDRKALLVHVHIQTWSARKFDRKVSDELTLQKKADPQAARVNKHLFGGKQKDHADVIAAAGKIREIHYRLTLPWRDTGWRLLPTKLWTEYTTQLQNAVTKFDEVVRKFSDNYDSLRATAALKMGNLFNLADYPASVRDKFGVQLSHMPVPSEGDFRLELDDARVQQIREETRKQVEEGLSGATHDLWARMSEVVTKVADKLEDPKGIFRDSLIGNLKAMVSLTESLNLMGDPAIEHTRKEMESLLVEPDILRKNPCVRADAAARARALADRMRGIFG